nr:yjgF family translation initiation inhibitor [Pandoravirus massiliensis]
MGRRGGRKRQKEFYGKETRQRVSGAAHRRKNGRKKEKGSRSGRLDHASAQTGTRHGKKTAAKRTREGAGVDRHTMQEQRGRRDARQASRAKATHNLRNDYVDDHRDDDNDVTAPSSPVPKRAGGAHTVQPREPLNDARRTRRNSDGGCCYAIPTPAFAAGDIERLGYAQAVRCGGAVWVSGTIGRDERDRLVPGGMRAQAEQVFDNLTESLRAAGCRGLEDIVHMTSYIVDIRRNAAAYIAVRARRMPDTDFASATVGVSGFPTVGALVNVTCMAIPHRRQCAYHQRAGRAQGDRAG